MDPTKTNSQTRKIASFENGNQNLNSFFSSNFQRRKNYLDNSCEFIDTPLPGPFRMSRIFMNLNPSSFSIPCQPLASSSNVLPSFPSYLENQTLNPNFQKLTENSLSNKKMFFQNKKAMSLKEEQEMNEEGLDLEKIISVDDSLEKQLKEIKNEKFIGHVKFYNEDDSICGHNFFIDHHNKQNKSIMHSKIYLLLICIILTKTSQQIGFPYYLVFLWNQRFYDIYDLAHSK